MSLIRRIETLEQQVREQQLLIHNYHVFCNWSFVHVANAACEDFQASWKQFRDTLAERSENIENEMQIVRKEWKEVE